MTTAPPIRPVWDEILKLPTAASPILGFKSFWAARWTIAGGDAAVDGEFTSIARGMQLVAR